MPRVVKPIEGVEVDSDPPPPSIPSFPSRPEPPRRPEPRRSKPKQRPVPSRFQPPRREQQRRQASLPGPSTTPERLRPGTIASKNSKPKKLYSKPESSSDEDAEYYQPRIRLSQSQQSQVLGNNDNIVPKIDFTRSDREILYQSGHPEILDDEKYPVPKERKMQERTDVLPPKTKPTETKIRLPISWGQQTDIGNGQSGDNREFFYQSIKSEEVLKTNYFVVHNNSNLSRKDLSLLMLHIWSKHFYRREFKFVDRNDLVFTKDSGPEEKFHIYFGFDYTICRASEHFSDETFLVGITTKLYCINWSETAFYDYKTLSPKSQKIFQRETAKISVETCFKKLTKYISVAEEDFNANKIFIELEPLQTTGKVLPPVKMIPEDGRFIINPASSNLISWMMLSLDPYINEALLQEVGAKIEMEMRTRGMKLLQQSCKMFSFESAKSINQIFCHLEQAGIKLIVAVIAEDKLICDAEKVIQYASDYYKIECIIVTSSSLGLNDTGDTGNMKETIELLVLKICHLTGGAPNVLDPTYISSFFKTNGLDVASTMILCRFLLKDDQLENVSSGFWSSLDSNFIVPSKKYTHFLSPGITYGMKQFHEKNGKYPKIIFFFLNRYYHDSLTYTASKAMMKTIKTSVNNVSPETKIVCLFVVQAPREGFILSKKKSIPKKGTFVGQFGKNEDYRCFYIFSNTSEKTIRDTFIRPTKYAIILNEPKLSLDFLGEFCYALCHYWYNFFEANDIPVPLEIAGDMAKRCEGVHAGAKILQKPATLKFDSDI